MARYHPDGSLDASFGSGGAVRTRFGRSFFGLQALALQADGKLVAAGDSNASGDSDFALARYVTTDEPLAVPRKCGGRRATILGTSRKDTIRGTCGPDVILGLGGNDTIRGLQGNDTICGGPGRDTLIGNEGNDRLLGEGQNDKLFGDNGSDSLDGGSGRDACRTGETARRCEGQAAARRAAQGSAQTAVSAGGQLPVQLAWSRFRRGELENPSRSGDSDAQCCEARRIRERFRPPLNLPLRKGETYPPDLERS